MRKYASTLGRVHELVSDYKKHCSAVIHMDKVEPRSMVKYDRILTWQSLRRKARELRKLFPGIDLRSMRSSKFVRLCPRMCEGTGGY
jgi:hypothetical protein